MERKILWGLVWINIVGLWKISFPINTAISCTQVGTQSWRIWTLSALLWSTHFSVAVIAFWAHPLSCQERPRANAYDGGVNVRGCGGVTGILLHLTERAAAECCLGQRWVLRAPRGQAAALGWLRSLWELWLHGPVLPNWCWPGFDCGAQQCRVPAVPTAAIRSSIVFQQ